MDPKVARTHTIFLSGQPSEQIQRANNGGTTPALSTRMLNLSDPLFQIRVTSGVCTSVAIFTTLFRITIRICKSQLWVDDAFAIFSMCALITQLVAIFINLESQHWSIVRHYLVSSTFYAVVWSARLSILFSIIQILRPNRGLFSSIVVVFVLAWIILTAQVYWECEAKSTSWKHTNFPQCKLSPAVGICQLIAAVISDGILLLLPIQLFMIIREKKLRYRLMVIFGTCIMTTIVSFVHIAFLFGEEMVGTIIATIVENAISLIVCNISIMVTAVLKMQKQNADSSSRSNPVPLFGKHTSTTSRSAADTSIINLYLLDSSGTIS